MEPKMDKILTEPDEDTPSPDSFFIIIQDCF